VVRLWVASVEFTDDIVISPTILTRLSEAYRKLPQHLSLCGSAICGFRPAQDALPTAELLEMDQWMLVRAEQLVRDCRRFYDELAFHRVYRAIYDFSTIDLSALYFDVPEGPPVHHSSPLPRPPQRADRALPHQLRAGAPRRSAPQLHRRRGLAAHAEARRRALQRPPRAFPEPEETHRRPSPENCATKPKTGSACSGCAIAC